MKLSDLKLTIAKIFGDADLILDDVSEWREYHDDKEKERKFLGHKYTVKCFEPFVKFAVKVPASEGTLPVISRADLLKSSKNVSVTIADGGNPVTFSGDDLFSVNMSVTAERLVINTKAQ